MSCIEGSNPSVSANTKTSNLGLFPIQGISSTPNFRMKRANKAKQIIVMKMLTTIEGQKPIRGMSAGNARNIGRVGTTYQNVYQAWFAIFSDDWFSARSQIRVSKVTSGSAAISPPNLSLRLAASETATTTAAVTRYFVMSQFMCGGLKHESARRLMEV